MRHLRPLLVALCATVSPCIFGQSHLPLSASAQMANGISGTIQDARGFAVKGAQVVLVPKSGGVSAKTTTDNSGSFALQEVPSGRYRLQVVAAGFQSASREVDTTQPVDHGIMLTLQVGSVETTVNVQSGRESLASMSSDTSSFSPIRVLDLPQSVQIANRELLDEQKAFQFADAVTYLAGVQRAYAQISGSIGNMLSMRGFILDTTNNYFRDGYKFFGVGRSDTADIERVEVLKGPASALYGTAEAGGVVNLVSKKPTMTPYVAITMNEGSYNFFRPEFDISGPLNRSNKLFYRLNGVYETTDSFRDYIRSTKEFAAPYFLWKPTNATSFAVLAELINVNRVSDYGIPLYGNRPAPVPISTNYGEPWNDEADRDRQIGTRFNHDFRSGWTLSNGFELARVNAKYFDVYTSGTDPKDPTMLVRYSNKLYFPYLNRYTRTTLAGQAKTGAIRHNLAVGFELGWLTATSGGPGGCAPDVSILHPQIGTDISKQQAQAAIQNPYFVLTYTTLNRNQGVYAQDQIDLGKHWKAVVGVRTERFYQDAQNFATGSHQRQTNYPVSPRAGLVYQPLDWLSFYGSYVQSFIPTSPSAVNTAGKQFSPEYDHQWEGGMKAVSASGRMMATIAGFQIVKNNILAPASSNPVFSVQNGQEKSKGVEFEFQGNPFAGLNLLTSYAFTQAQITASTVYPVGNLLPNAPRNSGAVWASFQAPAGWLRHLGISSGVVATSSRQDDFYNSALLPGYARLDGGVYYDIPAGEKQSVRFTFNMQNALDRRYYLASNGEDQVRPGSPRAVVASVCWTRH